MVYTAGRRLVRSCGFIDGVKKQCVKKMPQERPTIRPDELIPTIGIIPTLVTWENSTLTTEPVGHVNDK